MRARRLFCSLVVSLFSILKGLFELFGVLLQLFSDRSPSLVSFSVLFSVDQRLLPRRFGRYALEPGAVAFPEDEEVLQRGIWGSVFLWQYAPPPATLLGAV